MVVLLGFIAAWAGAQPVDTGAIDAFVAAEMRRHAIPGVAIAVTAGSEIAYAQGYGTAGAGRPLTPDTPMYIGSTSKAFTGLAIMQLAEQGSIELDTPVRQYLPWFALADTEAAESITLRHLLSHSSGLSDLQYVERARLPNDASIEAGVRDLRNAQPIDPPGTTFHYFNPGYATLGAIVEEVSGQSYGDYIRQHILAPLGMERTFTDPDAAHAAGLAHGHALMFGVPVPRTQAFRAYGLPAGFIQSTANDMARFLIAMNNEGATRDGRVLSRSGMLELERPYGPGGFYAMGWMVGSHRGEPLIQHGGANEFFTSEAMRLPDRDLGLVVLIDQGYLPSAFTAYPELAYGLLDVLMGFEPATSALPMRYAGYGLGLLLLILLAVWMRALRRLPTWRQRSIGWSATRRYADVAMHVLVMPAIFLSVILGMRAWMDRGTSIRGMADAIPDVALVLALSYAVDLAQAAYKVRTLLGNRSPGRMRRRIRI
jgi:CubicO group peptidase (beta-lactamase class C family)